MKFSISVSKRAIIHIEDAAEWFQNKQTGLEIRFLKEIDVVFKKLKIILNNSKLDIKKLELVFLKNSTLVYIIL